MNMILFCTAFIIQFVGHRIGDYILQTDWQAKNKSSNRVARLKHVIVYSFVTSIMMLFGFSWVTVIAVFMITVMEHYWVDSRKPVVGWKIFLEKKVSKQTDFKVENLPFFVLIEIDQTFHYIRIFAISLLIGHGII